MVNPGGLTFGILFGSRVSEPSAISRPSGICRHVVGIAVKSGWSPEADFVFVGNTVAIAIDGPLREIREEPWDERFAFGDSVNCEESE